MTNSNGDNSAYNTAIAIIGMAGRFPGARDVEAFWHNIVGGVKSLRFFTNEELQAAGVDPALLDQPNYVKAGAILDDIDKFDAAFFGLAPRDAETMDPQHRIFLECAWEALEDAAYDSATYSGLIGVFAGSGFSTYLLNNLYQNPALADIADPLLSAVGNERDALASTASYKFNLKGPSISVHTFCSTSLVAVHLACQSLLNYECDMALAGGVAIQVPHTTGYLYKEGGILSPDGECRSFDAKANGSVVGNGAGVVTLKRFAEALEDGDQIYAVIRGSALNNDGSMRVSYTAPGMNGQSEVIAEALGNAGVEAESISYIEAHGTGTMLGDSIELAAMKKAFALSTKKQQFCAIGSVKPNVGHLDRASGVTGLIKTTLALKNKLLPPSINFTQSHADIDLEHSPFYVNTKARRWENAEEAPRRAGVSSFGLGGTNVHMVLEEAPSPEKGDEARPWQLLLLSAKTENALETATQRLHMYLQEHEEVHLPDVAYTLQVGRNAFNHRRMLVCQDRMDALRALKEKRTYTQHQTSHNRSVSFLFPGGDEWRKQAHIYEGIARELYHAEPFFREIVDSCCSWLKTQRQMDLLAFLCPEDQRKSSGRNKRVKSISKIDVPQDIALADAAEFVIEYALAKLFMDWGIQPQSMLGYDLGEYVAACVAGVLSPEDALKLITLRASLLTDQPPAAVVAVALSAENIQSYLDEQVSLAVIHSPHLCMVAGTIEVIEQLEENFSQQNIEYERVETRYACHTAALSETAREQMAIQTKNISLHVPQIRYISNVTGTWITDEQATNPAYWATHMSQTIQLSAGIEQLLQGSENLLLEVGLGQSLIETIRQHPACTEKQRSLILSTLPSANEKQSAYAYFLQALGSLWLEGLTLNWTRFYAYEHRHRLSLPTYPFERKRYWVNPPPARSLLPSITQENDAQNKNGKQADISKWFYQPTWEESQLPMQPLQQGKGPWLIFEDQKGLGHNIANRLQSAGETVIRVQSGQQFLHEVPQSFIIRPHEKEDYIALCTTLAELDLLPGTILHLWSVTAEETGSGSPDTFRELQNYGFYSLIFLAQALAARIYDAPIQLIVISNALHEVSGHEPLIPEKATLLSTCKSIPQEYLNITCRSIDIDLPDPTEDQSPLINAILTESMVESTDYIVAYRQGTRQRLTYRPIHLAAVEEKRAHLIFRNQGTYLITGGLGGIGLTLATYLARTVHARLALIGHTAFPAREQWANWLGTHDANELTSLRIKQIQAIEELGGQVIVLQADVANREQLQRAVDKAYQQFGALHGVIHAAGVSSESAFRTIQEIGREQCEMHFQPKVYGLYALEQVLHAYQLDFCLLYSSLSSVLGGLGFAGYTAANIFMDAFVQRHNREATTMWTSINWDIWQVKEDAHGALGATIAQFAMRPEEGTEAFLRIIAHRGFAHLVNSTGNLDARISQWIQLASNKSSPTDDNQTEAARPHLSTDYVAARDEYEQRVVEIWQQVLGIEKIGIEDNFFELGGHSLMGTQLISRMRKAFQMEIPLGMLFEAPTIIELTMTIKLLLLEEIEKLDEKEAMRLI